jgi:electron transfer flavoprotein alpha subunit
MRAYLARASLPRKATSLPSSSTLLRRSYATEAGPKTLLFLEHRDGKLNPGSFNALTAANSLGGEVVALITGDSSGTGKAADASKKWVVICSKVKTPAILTPVMYRLPIKSIIVQNGNNIAKGLAEPLAPLIVEAVKKGGFTHVVAAHTALGKNVFPRVAALLDVAQVGYSIVL